MSTPAKELEKPVTEDFKPTEKDNEAALAFVGDLLTQPVVKEEDKPKEKEPAKPKAEKPVKAKLVKEPAPEPFDYEKLTEATAKGVATAMKPKDEPKPERLVEMAWLTESERKKLPVFEQMAKANPERYKGLVKAYTENLQAIDVYQKQWEKDNPGKEFDPEDDDHKAFYDKHDVDWDDDDFIEAKAEMVAERHIKKFDEKTGKKLGEMEAKERAREFEPTVAQEATRNGKTVFNQVGGEFKKIWGENGMDRATLDKIKAEDPLAFDVVIPEVMRIERLCAEMMRLGNSTKEFDTKNPEHIFLQEFATKCEEEMLALPKAEQRDADGRKFATTADYHAMTKSEQAKHYWLSPQDLNSLLSADLGSKLGKRLEAQRKQFEENAVKYGYRKESVEQEQEQEAPLEQPSEKPRMVSTGSDPETPATLRNNQHKPVNSDAAMLKELMS